MNNSEKYVTVTHLKLLPSDDPIEKDGKSFHPFVVYREEEKLLFDVFLHEKECGVHKYFCPVGWSIYCESDPSIEAASIDILLETALEYLKENQRLSALSIESIESLQKDPYQCLSLPKA